MRKAIPIAAAAAVVLPGSAVAGRAFLLTRKRPIEEFYAMRAAQPDFVALKDLPVRLVQMTLDSEDSEFYEHRGYNLVGIRDAVQINRRAGEIATGGSTITQQLAKNLYFHFGHSYLRKATELVIAIQAEHKLGKDKILELYLNIIYYGNGVYGVGDAARFYFGKEPADLSVNQMFMLAILPVVPTRGNPIQHPEAFEKFRNKRLALMSSPKHAVISPEEAEQIRSLHADCLDPDLREPDEFTDSYPQYITLTNERFGPFQNEGYRNPMGRDELRNEPQGASSAHPARTGSAAQGSSAASSARPCSEPVKLRQTEPQRSSAASSARPCSEPVKLRQTEPQRSFGSHPTEVHHG